MKWLQGHTKSKERNKKRIRMEDITNNDTKYASHNGSEIQRPFNVASNREEAVGENLVCNIDKENEQIAHMRENANKEALKEPLEDFF